jgi:type II secretory pathway component PulF
MKPRPLILLLLFLLLIVGFFYYFNEKSNALQHDKQIIDAVHLPHINPLFEKADAAKYTQDYPKANRLFQELLSKKLNAVDS